MELRRGKTLHVVMLTERFATLNIFYFFNIKVERLNWAHCATILNKLKG